MTGKRKCKYEQIQSEIAQQIQRNLLPPGARLPTEQELAETYHVSRLTVRQSLSGLINSGLVYAVQGRGTFVADKTEFTTSSDLKTIHLLFTTFHPNLTEDHFNHALLEKLCLEAGKRGYSLTVSFLPRHQSVADFMRSNGVPPTFKQGVILASVSFHDAEIEFFRACRIPHVCLSWFSEHPHITAVCGNSAASIAQCMDALLQYGHRKIAMICPPAGNIDFSVYFDGYRNKLKSAGIEPDLSYVATALPWEEESGRNAMRQLLKSGIDATALVVCGDRATFGAIRELEEHGIRIPEDLSLVVNDRYCWMDEILPVPLSGTQANFEGIAACLLDALDEQRASGHFDPREIQVTNDWIGGGSATVYNHQHGLL